MDGIAMLRQAESTLLRDKSRREAHVSPKKQLVEELWGISWRSLLPYALEGDDVIVELSSYDRALPFITEHYAAIFEEPAEGAIFFAAKLNDAKARFHRRASDFFEFKQLGRTIALLIGNPVDWSTYYFRSAAMLPEYQGKQLFREFVPLLFECLKNSGVERVQADTSPSNLAMMRLLTALGFNVTGTILSERWGAQVQLTKFLEENSETVFLQQFCSGVNYQKLRKS